jgi:hypothetical protein
LRTDTTSKEKGGGTYSCREDPENEMNFSYFGLNLRKDLIHDRIPDSSVSGSKKSEGDTFFAINL